MKNDVDYSRTLPSIPKRISVAHKGDFGRILGIGGSRGMAGSIALSGRSALLTGTGLLTLAVPDPILETVAGYYPELMTLPCPADRQGRLSDRACSLLLRESAKADAVFLGPGLGRSPGLNLLVERFLDRIDCPAVIDADALNAVAEISETKKLLRKNRPRPFVLTPHPGEFLRLSKTRAPSEQRMDDRIELARRYAFNSGVVLVLKGHRTIITDGPNVAINESGNPGMATAGSGDVLTGMIASFIGQQFSPYDAARLAVYLHGLAGDAAASRYGEQSVIAPFIVEAIPSAFETLRHKQTKTS